MLIDALVTDKGDAILRQTPADLIGTPLLLRQFFFDQLHQIWRHFARLVRGLLASLRGLLVRLLEAIAARAGVANKLAADRRRIDANLPRDVGLRVAALQERVNLAALFAGQMEIAFGHFSSVRRAVPRKDSLPSDRQKNRHTQHGKVWREKTSASRVLAALASSPATKALDPDPFPRHSLRHAVYAALLHFGFETAGRFARRLVGFFAGVVRRRVGRRERCVIWLRKPRRGLGGFRGHAAWVTRCGGACQAGEARALAAAVRRVAAQPRAWAAGHADAIATLIRRTLTRTRAPILSSLRRMVPQVACKRPIAAALQAQG